MILAYYRCYVPLSELRDACAVSRDGASLLDIVKAAKHYGLKTDGMKSGIDGLRHVPLPAIIHWDFKHFVVLERVRKNGADLVDPAVGRRSVSREEMDRSFTGVVLALAPGEDFKTRARSRRSSEIYRELWRGAKGPVLVMIMSGFILEVLGLIFPAATALVIDFIVRPKQTDWIPILGVVFFVTVLLRFSITLARNRTLGGIESLLDVELSASLVKQLLLLPTSFFSRRGPGDLLNRVEALLEARETFASVLMAGFDVVLVFLYGVLMLVYDPLLGALVAALEIVSAAVTILGRRSARTANTARQIAASLAQSALVQAFADPEIAKAFGAESLLTARYGAARARELNCRIEGQRAQEPSRQTLSIIDALGMALVLWLGGRAVLADRMTVGVLASFLALQTLLSGPLARIVSALQDLGDVGPLLDRVDDVLDTAPEPTGTYVPDRIEGAISFENVCFRYGSKGPLILDNLTFEIHAGERVAIAGTSGAGKSTVIRLILGFIQPTSGIVRIDGRDAREYNQEALRSSIGTVLAGGTFFAESVYDNVTLGAPSATPEDVRAALQAACIGDLIDGLPQGPLTPLGTGARRLSGGQRQRLLLARALAKNPSMLLLDEASSALDTELEHQVQSYLAGMRCTMLVVAHRLSAVALADRILFLQNGKVVQEGSFAALARQAGPFRELVRASGART
jgi:ABC-type bacteriocin/lantibiotic exporter with double-glycine peptidase domain